MHSSYRHYRRRPSSPLKRRLGIAFRLCLLVSPLVLLSAAALYGLATLFHLWPQFTPELSQSRPRQLVVDPSGLLSRTDRQTLKERVARLNHRLQADCRVVVLKSWDARDLRNLGQRLYRQWSLGEDGFGERGALLLVVKEQKKVSLVLGTALDRSLHPPHMVMPLHISDLLEDHQMKFSLEQKKLAEGIETSLNLIERQFQPEASILRTSMLLPSENEI